MSHDGSSCKSYIKHPTEKERLDNLAFTSFPEDYLPYTSAYHQHGGREGGKAPPYLVWDERRPRKSRKQRRRCCNMAALVSAIALIVTAILAVVAISIYLGVVTNLFRSPVLSLSGKFRVSDGDDFSEELLNNTSYQFLIKAESYQAVVENVLLSSSLEPAFIAARIYTFRPGMLVFFRVYLDRRKLKQDDSNTIELVESLFKTDSPAFGALSIDRESVDVDENEEWISIPGIENRISKTSDTPEAPITPPDIKRVPSHFPPPKLGTDPNRRLSLATRKPTRPQTTSAIPVITSATRDPIPIREVSRTGTGEVYPIGPNSPEEDALNFSYGQWKPVPIEDSVSPSFGDQRTPPGRGSVRFVDEVVPPPRVSPTRVSLDRINPPKRPTDSKTLSVGVGSVSVLEDPLSHMDPAPIPIRTGRPLRPVLSEAHPRGEVASSIMSSVSLVVRPTNNKNKTSVPESGKLEMVKPVEAVTQHPYRHPVSPNDEPPIAIRKDHASYRFLEDMDTSSEATEESELKTMESRAFQNEDFSSTTVSKFVASLSNNKEDTDSSLHDAPKKFNQSSVEYLEHEMDSEVEITDATAISMSTEENSYSTVSEEMDIVGGNLSFVSTTSLPQTTGGNMLYVDSDVSEYDYNFAVEDSSSSNESTTEDIAEYVASIDMESRNDVFHIYKAKNESELKYENYSSLESTTSVAFTEITKLPLNILFRSGTGHFFDNDSEETFFNSSDTDHTNLPSLQNEDAMEVDSERTTDSSSTDSENTETTVTSIEFSTTENYFHSVSNTNDSEQLNDSVFDHVMTNTGDVTDQAASNPSTKSIPVSELDSLDIHTLEGHGFHQPIKPIKNTPSTENPLENTDNPQNGTNQSITMDTPPSDETSATIIHQSSSDLTDTSELISTDDDETSGTNQSITMDTLTSDENSAMRTDQSSSDLTDTSELISTDETLADSTTILSETFVPTHLDVEDSNVDKFSEAITSTIKSLFESSTDPSSSTTEVGIESESSSSLPSTDLNAGGSNNSSPVLSGVAKIVPQISDLSSNPNDIESYDGSFIGLDDDLHKADVTTQGNVDLVEIIHHITTLAPTVPPLAVSLGKHPIFIAQTCLEDEMQCDSGECIDSSSRCNMRRDCRDNSDEKNCSCSELLKIMGQSQKICDGVEDCQDHSDEQNCPWCDNGQIICPQSKFCVNRTQMCDGHNDCPMGTDEKYCVKLAESATDAEGVHYRSSGYLMVRKEGKWGKLCLDNLQDSDSLRLKLDELGEAVCSTLTYRNMSESKRTSNPVTGNDTYYVISNQAGGQAKRSSAIFKPSACESKEVMRVQCGSLDCGHRPMATSSRRRIVGGNSAASGSWPWQVALYKEGDFQCGAVLISDSWLVSAGHCFYSSRSAHWTARLGLLRRGSELQSPYEQIHRIEQIFLHPDYVDTGFINDIAMLKLEKPVLFSDYLRPVCLPLANEDAGMWHGKQCSVVGWGKLYEIGHTFPDSLQEVRLPVISTEECRKKIIFLTMYHLTDNMFCAGYERGGRDACLGDSGGPLMCQRDDGRWILLGVTSNGDGCGRPGRPGVYTKVAQYLSWIKEVMESKHPSPTYEDTCDGIRCKLGRCIPPYKMCDSRWDCSEGSDEDNCVD